MEINNRMSFQNINWICKIGLFAILILPILAIPTWIFPPDWGKTIIFRSILSVILFLFFYNLVYKNGRKFSELFEIFNLKKNIVLWLMAVLFILFLLATIFSKDPLFSFFGSPNRGAGSLNFIFYIIFSITVFLAFEENDWKKVWELSVFVGVLVALIAVFQFYGLLKDIFIPFEGRPPSVIGGAIFLGTYLLLLFFITLSLFIKEKNKGVKIFYIISLILFLSVIMITGSRAAYFGLIAGLFYFFFFYSVKFVSQKNKRLIILSKILSLIFVATAVLGVYYINYGNEESKFFRYLESNKTTQGIISRLSIKLVLADPRFSAWRVGLNSIKERPILGWGPENFSVAFDKYYDPSLPYLSKAWGGWWDRAHNLLIEMAVTAGIPAMLAYLSIFVILFWQLQKGKQKEENKERRIIFHGLQATLIAYLADNFFTFDTFSSYIILFLLVAYSLYLINKNQLLEQTIQTKKYLKTNPKKRAVAIILFCVLLLFLWQYNIKPFLINIQINMADYLISKKDCPDGFQKMEKILPQHSFLDSFLRIQYIRAIQKCAENNPANSVIYAQKGAELLQEAVKIQPFYSRSWIFLGAFTTIIANAEKDQVKKNNLLSEADRYLKKANELAPNHQEIILEQAKIELIRQDYPVMKEKAKECILLDPNLGDCYWFKALSEIYLKDFNSARDDINKASNGIFYATSILSLQQLVNAYTSVENYKELVATYKKLIDKSPQTPKYHSALAFAWAKIGEYKKARYEALIFLRLMPEAKDEVDYFLKTLQ